MSYQVLARKWRPHDFSSLLGQDHVVRALTHALTENRLHHAYLFTGTRGVGKTTISRILAKCLNCVGPDGKGGITAEPCGVCEACRAIDEDRFVDYIEMDAASTRGIDDMVSLLERAKYVPTNARFKVYMIDEVHQLTSAAFNAMLKTLEEPPEYVKFILATTDPQKVPVTVLSRCLQFNLKSLSPQLISSHMAELLEKEQISFEKPALRMLASGARGSMRDGLSLLDQAIAYSAGNVTLESVREMLGTIDSTTLIRLLGALANHEPKEIMKVADEIGARSLSYTQAMKDLAVLLHRIAMAQQLPEILTDEEPDAPELRQLASVFSPDEVQLFYQIAIHGRNDMALAPDEYAGFTMALLRMLAFAPLEGKMPKSLPAAVTHKEEAPALPKTEPAKTELPAQQKAQSVDTQPKAPEAPAAKEVNPQPKAPEAEPFPPEIAAAPAIPSIDMPDDDAPWVPETDSVPPDDLDWMAPPAWPEEYSEEAGVSVLPPAPQEKQKEYIPAEPVQMNAWLEAAEKIHLDPASQPLVTSAELESFDGQNMKLTVDLEKLTAHDMVAKLAAELKKVLGSDVLVTVTTAPSKYQNLRTLYAQRFLAEKQKKLSELKKDKRILSFMKVFNVEPKAEDLDLLDKEGKVRTI
ncbi:DNA polymerase III subunit gamma/tau [Parasutterella excrementihominis]|uniref:DNA polymerase III subunit gamma/tau n=1 Tax=Parasutterella excrementihominis TaxID=487175 RepID=UPI003AB192D3